MTCTSMTALSARRHRGPRRPTARANRCAYEIASEEPLVVPDGGPPRGVLERPGDVIRNLDNANAWLALLNAEEDPAIADLMMSVLDQLQPGIVATQGKMRNRGAFFFIASPNSITPVHIDIEFSLLLQFRGTKTVSFGRWESDAVRRSELNRYWEGSHGRVEAMPEEMVSFHLSPGEGVYIPPCTPHWVTYGPETSPCPSPSRSTPPPRCARGVSRTSTRSPGGYT